MESTQSIIVSARKREIVNQYATELDKHIAELKAGRAEAVLEIRDFAGMLHVLLSSSGRRWMLNQMFKQRDDF